MGSGLRASGFGLRASGFRLRAVAVLSVVYASGAVSVFAAGAVDTALIDAVKRSDLKAARSLIAQRADVNAAERDGTTALHWAVEQDDSDMIDALLRAGARASATNRFGVAPLQMACVNGSAQAVARLLTAGADVHSSNPGGETALMTCARTGNVAAIKVLVDRGADVNAKESWHGQTALMWTAAEGHAEATRFLIAHGADITARSSVRGGQPNNEYGRRATRVVGGFTPLLFAAREGRLAAAEVLLDAGAKAGDTAPDGTSALILAIINAHFDVAALLLERGADPNVADEKHGSALHSLAWVRRQAPAIGMGSASMYPRIPSGDLDSLVLARRLLEKGANPNVRFRIEDGKFSQGARGNTFYYVANPPDFALAVSTLNWDGATPFWLAAKNADAPYMRLLADFGADPLMPNRVKVTPLMVAAGAGYMQGECPGTEMEALEATRLALELGNDVHAVARFDDGEDRADLRFSGMTALHGAAQRGANSIVSLLVEKGARLDLKTREGWTPFNIADGIQIGGTLKNSPETAALLRRLMTERGIAVEEIHLDNFAAAGSGK